jgi:hypothetical protein
MAIAQDDGKLVEESTEEFETFFAQPDMIHYVILATRPRAATCCTTLEHNFYKPDTKRNEKFFLRFVEWGGLPWIIVSIPFYEKENMEHVAAACRLRIVNGIPAMINGEVIIPFPVNTPQTFTIEHIH